MKRDSDSDDSDCDTSAVIDRRGTAVTAVTAR